MNSRFKIAILGFGLEGKSVMKYLKSNSEYQNCEIMALDKKFSPDYLKNLKQFNIIFRSPGLPYLTKEIQSAKNAGVKITSATKLFFDKCPCPIIGITGSKGKGTTATLLSKMLKTRWGDNIFLIGNIGLPALKILPKLKKNSLVIFELSSFQLQDLRKSPNLSIVLDITPEHQDHHQTFKEYADAKSSISRFQTKNDITVFSRNNPWPKKIAAQGNGRKIGFSLKDKKILLSKIKKIIPLPGRHNLQNAYAATIAAKTLKIPEQKILREIKNFKGLPYRLELIHKSPNIYNDSASTNPEAVIAGIKATNPTILIMGGKNKKLSYKNLRKAVLVSPIKKIYLYGDNKNELKNTVGKNKNITVKILPTLSGAVKILKKEISKNDTALFSPGAASFDQFKNYEERGRKFNQLLNNYIK
ncbi:MAG: UDP-N-acetylmuramoylalanine--D-glutamate ligase [Candidatus Harrisonbacteria bacterium RIFCSPHIGHO2_02_FULL_42_16]|uniref:UDP-N-acetylmuramoylalanine--D-glutamate ligase n=1 Tax=Candidatus Harrisonbacteria bacterium RIFCSPHIGHO2_02_FULL_42_16 TaxID=1798404 RepID=A0A1G1ZH51_9BACT|nr:MAG: UDP-N-acetylmuramoylalanine--D-glutamate ligase [Candidatus Harrisonbacteria bacterium RIFCSPHIGHO2_02_FULL_42_16]